MAHHVHEAIFSLDRVARCALKASDTLPSLSEDNAHAARLSAMLFAAAPYLA